MMIELNVTARPTIAKEHGITFHLMPLGWLIVR